MLETIVDNATTLTGIVGTTILCCFSRSSRMRLLAFVLYVIANITLGLLAHMKGMPMTSLREVYYLVMSFVGIYNELKGGKS